MVATVTQQRGASEISVPSVESKGADFNVLHKSLSENGIFWHFTQSTACFQTEEALQKRP